MRISFPFKNQYFKRTASQKQDPKIRAKNSNHLWNDPFDLMYTNSWNEQQHVLHIFHQEWHGIRAAAGALGGQKLAITAATCLLQSEIEMIANEIAVKNFDRIVCHAMSHNMSDIIHALLAMGLKEKLFVVMHGTQVQWADPRERELSLLACKMAQKKQIKKIHFLKNGFDLESELQYKPLLLNVSPSLRSKIAQQNEQATNVALSAGWGNLGKNVHSNVFGAALSTKIHTVWHCAPDIVLPEPYQKKIQKLPRTDRSNIFALIKISGVCLNASLFECHPVFNLESQAHQVPCIRGRLFLDAKENHPYVKLVTVDDVASVTEIKERINKLYSIPLKEIQQMTTDYQNESDAVSRQRYREFLEI